MIDRDHVLQVVRETLALTGNLDLEEVVAEAHIYLDLGLKSIDILDFVFRIERAFKLMIGKSTFFRPMCELLCVFAPGEHSGPDVELYSEIKGRWEAYKQMAELSMERPLEFLCFSGSAHEREKQIYEFCSKHGVVPFSVGFLVECVLIATKELATRGA